MLRMPTSRLAMRWHMLTFMVALCLPFFAKANLDITVITEQNGNEVTADFLVTNFDDIIAMQFPITWDPAELEFVSITNFNLPTGPNLLNFGTTFVDTGLLLHSWYDQTLVGQTMPDCSTVFRVTFHSVNGSVPPIEIDFNNSYMVVEIIHTQGEVALSQTSSCGSLARLRGNVFGDENANCIKDAGEVSFEEWMVKIVYSGNAFYCPTNLDGDFFFNCPAGAYDVSLILPEDNVWEACQPTYNLELVENQQATLDVGTVLAGQNPSDAIETTTNGRLTKVTPNPVEAGQPIFIGTQSDENQLVNLQIFDTSGKLLWEQQIGVGNANIGIQPDLSSGLYLLKATNANAQVQVTKLVVY